MMNKLRVFSMFSGIGGFEKGIIRALDGNNVDFVGYSEVDKYAESVFRFHFPDIRNFGDATRLDTQSLPDFDMLVGGFPCQAFSVAGLRQGFEDTRGTLFFDIARILKDKEPQYFLLENVKGLLSHEGGKTFTAILDVLTDLGFVCQSEVLNSRYFSVPQNRERIFIFGVRGECCPKVFPLQEDEEESHIGEPYVSTAIDANYWKGSSQGYGGKNRQLIIHNVYGGFGEKQPRVFEDVCPTIRTPQGGGHLPLVVPTAYRTRTYLGKGGNLEDRSDNVANSLTGCSKDSMLAVRYVRSEEGKRKRREHRQKTGEDYTPFGNPNRELVPVKDDCSGAITNALNRDTFVLNEDMEIRKLTPTECERLQGFPDHYTKYGVVQPPPSVGIPCKKRQVWAAVVTHDNKIFWGTNHVYKDEKCLKTWDGKPYDICYHQCGQESHAEIEALFWAKKHANRADMHIIGQDRCCEDCQDAMEKAGIRSVSFGHFPVVEISDTQRYKMLGNAVTVTVVQEIMRKFGTVCLTRPLMM